MGVVANIKHNEFPPQTKQVGKRVSVCFHYDTTHNINGVIVREDAGAPFVGIIRLEDDRYVLMTECQYSFIDPPEVNINLRG